MHADDAQQCTNSDRNVFSWNDTLSLALYLSLSHTHTQATASLQALQQLLLMWENERNERSDTLVAPRRALELSGIYDD